MENIIKHISDLSAVLVPSINDIGEKLVESRLPIKDKLDVYKTMSSQTNSSRRNILDIQGNQKMKLQELNSILESTPATPPLQEVLEVVEGRNQWSYDRQTRHHKFTRKIGESLFEGVVKAAGCVNSRHNSSHYLATIKEGAERHGHYGPAPLQLCRKYVERTLNEMAGKSSADPAP